MEKEDLICNSYGITTVGEVENPAIHWRYKQIRLAPGVTHPNAMPERCVSGRTQKADTHHLGCDRKTC